MENEHNANERLKRLMKDLNLSIEDLSILCDKSEASIYSILNGNVKFPGWLMLALDCHERARDFLSGVVEESRKNKDVKKLRDAERYRKHICGV